MMTIDLAAVMEYLRIFWKPITEVGLFWFAYYLLFVYIQDSGMVQALKGLAVLVIIFFAAVVLELKTILWILTH